MGATNSTPNYSLSQFVGTDKPAWLQDYNGDMLKIDTGINAAKVAADNAGLAAGAAQSDATTANNAITNTITPAITSLQTTVGNQGGTINTITSLIGNGTPTTTDQTIIGAINEINAKVGDDVLTTTAQDCTGAINELAASIGGGSVEVVGDGTKTYTQLLDELFALIDPTKITARSTVFCYGSVYHINEISFPATPPTEYHFINTQMNNSGAISVHRFKIASSSSMSHYTSIALNGTVTPTDSSSSVVTSGVKITLNY